jgi:pimeloyl-ACP methyl ester carboxylesterase
MPDLFIERDFSVRGLQIRVKHWHMDAPVKIIALHGWLDNAASFDVLAPLLPNCSIAAIDLPGQGFSDKRPASATYHLWDDLVDIISIANLLGWQEFSVIGHSRGAMLATLLGASFPERIRYLLLLDGLVPEPVTVEASPAQLRRHIDDYAQDKTVRLWDSREQALAVRAKAGGIPLHVAELLAARQLRQGSGGWYWDADERLKAASAFKMTSAHNAVYLAAIQCPVLVVLADKGWSAGVNIDNLKTQYPHFFWHIVTGHHHLHMDKPAVEVAVLCLEFLR